MQGQGVKLNIGSGTHPAAGFQNLDNSPSILVSRFPRVRALLRKKGWLSEQQATADWTGVSWRDVTRGLPYPKESVDKIYSSHFLEHVPEKKGRRVIEECYRVLRRGGRMRLIVPDLLFHAERYVERTRRLLQSQLLSTDRRFHDEFMDTVAGSYLKKGRKGAQHCYMYDLPTLVHILKGVGFVDIERCDYQQGKDPELYLLDSRPLESLHIEVTKPKA